jgi:putative DNA primase/helicase
MGSLSKRKSPTGGDASRGHRTKLHVHSNLDAREVKALARGRWLSLLSRLAPRLEAAIARPGHHVACPVHGGKDGFRLYRDVDETGGGCCNTCGAFSDGLALLMWLNGWGFREALQAVADGLGLASDSPRMTQSTPFVAAKPVEPNERALAALQRVWRESLPGEHPDADPLRRYLSHRGLGQIAIPSGIRFHPRLAYHHEGERVGEFPAMLAHVLAPDGQSVTIHRTYLTAEGRKAAPVWKGEHLEAKKLMPAVVEGASMGGSIRLYEAGPVLAVAEGIETALSVHLDTGLPTWAAVSAGGLSRLVVPDFVREVVIAADRDTSGTGQRAALRLAMRLIGEGRQARVAFPPREGSDWNDLAREASDGR